MTTLRRRFCCSLSSIIVGKSQSLRHADHDPGVTAERLASESRIICGGRAGGLRISLHAYNDGDDVDRLVEALRRL